MEDKSKIIAYGILRALGILGGIILILWFLYKVQAVIMFIAIAAVVSLIGRPIVTFLKTRLKFGDVGAAITTLLIVMGIIVGIIAIFVPILIDQSEHISKINFEEVQHNINRLNVEFSRSLGVDQVTLIEGLKQSDFIKNFDISVIPTFINSILGNFSSLVVGLLSVTFISFFLLKDSRLLLDSFLVFANKGEENKFKHVFHKTKHLLSRYFIGILLQLLILFVIYSILLFSFQIPNAFAIALFCAMLNVVPYIGPVIGCGVMMLLVISGYFTADFETVILPKMIYIFIGYCIAQLIDNFINQPLIFGNSVKSHPLEIFLVIIIAGLLFGILGMVIAIPTYTAIKVVAQEFLSEYKIVQKLTKNL
ncbi:AI-2E family transporter [Leeuwenhoekiella aequorea]|uniref:Putative PurR-regulated permease PerM n=1 Tax=Leeuwenhoekiella aequorea TaxID=283736 RepID=A0A4Q0PAN0_9FLAO|nr:AI-2E family transporter [Leeuwenhoekiella aequorea]AOE08857.1 permease [uncultured bacterium]RXG23834.1 putative PurR-regulated permease PerM [Leeuwenhoekiella aequorea]|tara:strand:+ start:244 stop:1338 length:1095 start_codon:yes stop_codon:yes gene_type:complete